MERLDVLIVRAQEESVGFTERYSLLCFPLLLLSVYLTLRDCSPVQSLGQEISQILCTVTIRLQYMHCANSSLHVYSAMYSGV